MADSVRWLRIDFDKCIKAGECYYNHPELFRRTDSGYPALRIRRAATPAQFREAQEAMEVCPSRAISYEDDSTD
ncbi:MAG: Ferredoxin [Caulobacteraceae bacterium]|nr:Ferredoxin [Caulobacteraceae bacterium]